jgi:nucleoside-diphosphate-sugar epimerase
LQAAVMSGAANAGARLVVLENLYMYGPTQGQPLTEDLSHSATTRKGTARANMSRDLMAAHAAGDVEIAIGRASDYFGPRGLYSAMGERVFYPAVAGKKSRLAGKLDVPHTYSYIPDIARGLLVLGEREEALGRAWHLPNAPTITTREFVEKVYRAAGNKPNMSGTPRFILKLVARKDPNVAEVIEMLYEFEEPFVVDHSQFVETFGAQVTPLDEAIEATVDWFRANPEPEA